MGVSTYPKVWAVEKKIQDIQSRNVDADLTLGYCFFGAIKLSKNTDPDKYGYSDYGMGFDVHSQFSFLTREWGKTDVNFCVDDSSSRLNDNKKRYPSSW